MRLTGQASVFTCSWQRLMHRKGALVALGLISDLLTSHLRLFSLHICVYPSHYYQKCLQTLPNNVWVAKYPSLITNAIEGSE